MYYGVRFDMDYKGLWNEGMKDWDGQIPPRMIDDSLEESFWESFLAGKSKPDDWITGIREQLLSLITEEDHVLEIGPGWGNYTFDVAAIARTLTCVDSSKSVLRYLSTQALERGYGNLSFEHAKWEERASDSVYDVVFGVNCYYRMQDIDKALIHMNQSAKRLAVIGMTSGPEKPHYWDIHQELGCSVKFHRRDYIYLTNLLYQLGIDVNCKILNLQKTYAYKNEEELIQDNLNAIMDKNYDRNKAIDILNRYVNRENGKIEYTHAFKAAILYWKPIK
ncbi:class I SAM-dependent methyltransferase [Paenibacillus alkaliterrae]|uniref:class I SAM-dependent methyltransferase n=1 Tax=Paenibacillus alkaliterrae TaxID=320909 RepID=UPI001F2D9C32|nr:class I SAM-dependent methyltransferase [Paenibacillus alkaliterrae]MCF2940332.1 class I SAM-dependent methyltransferase [Paenibacillus alkaliterrae]